MRTLAGILLILFCSSFYYTDNNDINQDQEWGELLDTLKLPKEVFIKWGNDSSVQSIYISSIKKTDSSFNPILGSRNEGIVLAFDNGCLKNVLVVGRKRNQFSFQKGKLLRRASGK